MYFILLDQTFSLDAKTLLTLQAKPVEEIIQSDVLLKDSGTLATFVVKVQCV